MECDHTILVVDDDDDVRESLREALEDEGYHVATASNGQDALEQLDQIDQTSGPPCLILLDLMMPVMDGRQFLSRHVQDPSRRAIPVVVVSACFGDGALTGAAETISKPIDLERLLDVADRHCASAA